MREKMYRKIIKILPKKLKYLIFIDIVCHSTSGKYSNTEVPKITAMEAIQRYGDDFEI